MEKKLSNNFKELTETEMTTIDGGEWKWYNSVLIWLCVPASAPLIINDLKNCYENGYAEGSAL